MRSDFHVHFHGEGLGAIEEKLDEAIGLLRNLQRSEIKMNTKLQASLAAATAAIADIQGKDESIRAYIAGEPDRTKAALQAFADEHDLDDAEVADTIDGLVKQATDSVQGAFEAINSNPAPGDTPLTPPAPSTPTGGAGDDSLGGGQSGDSVNAATGDDSLVGGQGGDQVQGDGSTPVAVVSSDPSVVSQTVGDGTTHDSVIVTDHPTDGTTLVTPIVSGTPDAGSISVDSETGAPVADPASGVQLGDTTVASDETPSATALAEANPSAVVSSAS